MLQEMPVMSSGGGGADISGLIGLDVLTIAQSTRYNALYTVGISRIEASTSGTPWVEFYSDSNASQIISSRISGTTPVEVDVSNYDVIYMKGSAATVGVTIAVKS